MPRSKFSAPGNISCASAEPYQARRVHRAAGSSWPAWLHRCIATEIIVGPPYTLYRDICPSGADDSAAKLSRMLVCSSPLTYYLFPESAPMPACDLAVCIPHRVAQLPCPCRGSTPQTTQAKLWCQGRCFAAEWLRFPCCWQETSSKRVRSEMRRFRRCLRHRTPQLYMTGRCGGQSFRRLRHSRLVRSIARRYPLRRRSRCGGRGAGVAVSGSRCGGLCPLARLGPFPLLRWVLEVVSPRWLLKRRLCHDESRIQSL